MVYTLEQTPTWAVAAVCTLIVLVSLIVERLINLLGKKLKEKKQKPLFEALEKMKEELMVMGFISLLLTVFQASIINLCMPEAWSQYMLPCPYVNSTESAVMAAPAPTEAVPVSNNPGALPPPAPVRRKLLELGIQQLQVRNLDLGLTWGSRRLLLARPERFLPEVASVTCPPGKVPIISLEGLHQLHIFIFVMTVVHVGYSCVTVFLGFYKMHGWKHWEEETRVKDYDSIGALRKTFKMSRTKTFVAAHKAAPFSSKSILSWIVSFFRQFGTSVVKSDYLTLRLGFISTHKLSHKFDFHSYIRRSMEDDFKAIVGISGFLWAFVVLFLLLNVHDWYTYFWIAFLPILMILVVGTKLQHIIQQLALETAQSQGVIGENYVKARDSLFWFNRPQILLYLIHFILFQNSFELAFFFWILTTFGFNSCFMGKAGMVLVRLVMGTVVQLLCSYSTLPLYALVTQMGSHYKKAIFQDKTAQAIHGWHNKAKQNKKKKDKVAGDDSVSAGKSMLESMNESSSGDHGSNQGFEFSLTASSRNLLSHLKLKTDADPTQQRMQLLEAGEAGGSDESAWIMDEGSAAKHRADQDETAEVYAFEVPDPTGSIAAAQNLTQRPGSQSSWLRVQKLVLNPKGDQRGGSSGEYENPSDGLL